MKWRSLDVLRARQLEHLIGELFRAHDLNGNGLLEEEELVQLNLKVAMLHYGKDVNKEEVRLKYKTIFREKLDEGGGAVEFVVFRRYVLSALDQMEPDPVAQEMIVEQFLQEAKCARATFHCPSFASSADGQYLPNISVISSVADQHSFASSARLQPRDRMSHSLVGEAHRPGIPVLAVSIGALDGGNLQPASVSELNFANLSDFPSFPRQQLHFSRELVLPVEASPRVWQDSTWTGSRKMPIHSAPASFHVVAGMGGA